MTDSELRSLADALARLARPYLEKNEPLREAVALLGRWLTETANAAGPAKLEAEEPPTNRLAAEQSPPVPAVIPVPDQPFAPPVAPSPPIALVPLRLGPTQVDISVSGTAAELAQARRSAEIRNDPHVATTSHPEIRVTDLELVERRCRLKAASCRLFVEKRAAAADPLGEALVIERMREMIAEAKSLPECFLWVFWRERMPPVDESLRSIAACYEGQADAVAALRRVEALAEPDRELGEQALRLLAEANSALLAALGDSWLKDDRDQTDVHLWLRRETSLRGIYLDRHMSLEDLADPADFEERAARIRDFVARLDQRADRTREIRGVLSLIRYHAHQLLRSVDNEASASHRKKIATAIARLGIFDIPATDARIADAIGSEAAEILRAVEPENPLLERCLEAMRLRAVDTEDADEDDEREPLWSERVLDARKLLRGRRMVIIGGRPRQPAMDRLSRAFELADIEWVDLTEHGSGLPMVAPIQRADTTIVVVILKLTGHQHADDARACAAAAGTACVLLSGGYNPERVAQEVLEQASERLRRKRARA